MAPFISVVIPVKNEEDNIKKCINSILVQSYGIERIEIVVIDNGSDDNTIQILNEITNKQVSYYIGVEGTIGAIRNFGAKKCKGEIIAFIDADCIPDPDWLSTAVEKLQSDSTIGCIGFTDIYRDETFPWVQQAWQHICSTNKCQGCCDVTWLASFNLVLWRNLFNQLGGFNEELVTCEDAEFGYRLSKEKRLIMCDTTHVHHLGESKSLLEFYKKEYWRGESNLNSFIKSSNKSHDFISVFVPLCYLFIVFSNLVAILFLPFGSKSYSYEKSVFFLTLATFFIPLLLTTFKSTKVKNLKKFTQVTFLLFVYLIARGLAIFK